MKMPGVLPFGRLLLDKYLHKGGAAIDATAGKGTDTLFLAERAAIVYAFDIQKQAIDLTAKRIEHAGHTNVHLIHDSHVKMLEWVPQEVINNTTAVVFNLGYLPSGDKSITTTTTSTIQTLENLLPSLPKECGILITAYPGHTEGAREQNAVDEYISALNQHSFHAAKYQFINQINHPPLVYALEKR